MITLTPAFEKHIENATKDGRSVQLDVTTTGCSGMAYKFTFVPFQGERFVVTPKAESILEGATIDYVQEGLSWGIKISNPNESAKCGCGESFSV